MNATSDPVVALTPAAIARVKHLIGRAGVAAGLRIGVRGGGCSGLSYTLGLEPAPNAADLAWEVEGVQVFVDPRSARYLEGTTVDFSLRNILDGGFEFQNPNATRTCGCGTSFSPRK